MCNNSEQRIWEENISRRDELGRQDEQTSWAHEMSRIDEPTIGRQWLVNFRGRPFFTSFFTTRFTVYHPPKFFRIAHMCHIFERGPFKIHPFSPSRGCFFTPIFHLRFLHTFSGLDLTVYHPPRISRIAAPNMWVRPTTIRTDLAGGSKAHGEEMQI